MSQTSSSETPVTKLARFIVDKRKAFFLVFLAAVLFCGSSIDKVVVNNDITSYLPAETETRRGLTLMDEELHHLRLRSGHALQCDLPPSRKGSRSISGAGWRVLRRL